MALVVVNTYFSIAEATVAVSSLRAAGMSAFILHEFSSSMHPHLQIAFCGTKIAVPEEEYEDASAILKLTEQVPDNLENEAEAFQRMRKRGHFGFFLQWLFGFVIWFPWWGRCRKFKK